MCGSPAPDASLSMAAHGQWLARRLVRGNWTRALSMATAARASLIAMTNLQSAAAATSLCWSRGLLEPVGGRAARLTARRRKLHPAARRAASNVVQTPGVATMYAGATTGDWGRCKREWPFFADASFFELSNVSCRFCWGLSLVLLEPLFYFAGSVVRFCFNQGQRPNAPTSGGSAAAPAARRRPTPSTPFSPRGVAHGGAAAASPTLLRRRLHPLPSPPHALQDLDAQPKTCSADPTPRTTTTTTTPTQSPRCAVLSLHPLPEDVIYLLAGDREFSHLYIEDSLSILKELH